MTHQQQPGRDFGVLYDSTFDAIIDPHDARFGHQHIPRVPAPFSPLNQCGAISSDYSSTIWMPIAVGFVALSALALVLRRK